MRQRGFTLVELIVVMVVTGVLAAGLVVFFRPALDSYAMATRRATLTDLADGAVRTMVRDVRSAVPNSIRQPNDQCFEVVPTSAGGRLRVGPDIASTAADTGAWVDTNEQTTKFDVISTLSSVPAINDQVVFGAYTPVDVYGGASRGTITAVAPPPQGATGPALGTLRISIAQKQFPAGYEGGRFVIVPNAQQAVFYTCANAGLDANGNGTGTLYRFSAYGFEANQANTCKVPAASTAIVATRIEKCEFNYDPNPGSVQGAGYMQMRLRLTEQGDSVDLLYGAHADNLP